MLVDGRLETKIQSVSVRFTQPPNDSGWIGTYHGGRERTDIESLVTRTAAAGTRWHTIEERDERALSATYYLDEQQPAGRRIGPVARALSRVRAALAPRRRSHRADHRLDGEPPGRRRHSGRSPRAASAACVGRFAAWVPIDAKNELQFRAEGGAVLAPTRDGIPSTLLFRTGGDTTVRGYDFESLGVQEGDAIVPGRYYAVVSVEAIHWINEVVGHRRVRRRRQRRRLPCPTRTSRSATASARACARRSGPFRLDVAYGQDVHKVRVHFSVGLTF